MGDEKLKKTVTKTPDVVAHIAAETGPDDPERKRKRKRKQSDQPGSDELGKKRK